jgi:hypothetical protein
MMLNDNLDADQARQNEWVECPKCRSVMLPLRDYDIQTASEFPSVGAELWEFLVFGWIVFVYNFAVGLLGFGGQKARLAKQKKDFLPAFPNSLICPRCFYVLKR